MAGSKIQALWNHPAGPKTIHFWAPTFKWGISIANVADFSKPPEQISYPHQITVAISGVIWSRYSTIIIPVFVLFLDIDSILGKSCWVGRKTGTL
ncbi:mitochondrial pyruvate carrier 4-like isoform X1 [Tasmannia lanceolata]|uniref:mitochondrial pyruvate carrier 4-like isoform X1 n=1 Tax=Tasmannia lanceolata TaxID=3420 RepID=UPI004063E194